MFKKKPKDKSVEKVDLEGIDKKVYNKRWLILVALLVAEIGVMIANSSLNMAMPTMSKDLGLTQASMTWIINIYTLIFASFLFISGAIGDKYGRKKALLTGLAIFVVGTVHAAFVAQTATELIVARAIMGFGGSLVLPTTLSIINNSFPSTKRAQAIAIWGAVAGVGMMFGSIISGLILEFFSWHSLFLFSTFIATAGLIFNAYITPDSKDEVSNPIDWTGGALTVVGLFSLVYGITEAPATGLLDPLTAGSIALGIVALVGFVIYEIHAKHPMLDMNLFKNRSFAISSLTLTLTFLALSGVFFSLSQVEQLILGFTPLTASLALIPVMLPMMIVSPFIPKLAKKIGSRYTVAGGLALSSIGFLVMSTWTHEMTYFDLLLMGAIMMTGISAAMTPGTNTLMASVPRNRSGMGSAVNDTTRELGSALGVALLGAILAAKYESEIAPVAAKFTGDIRTGIESSLAVVIQVGEKMGPAGEGVIVAAKIAWMHGVESTAIAGAIVIIIGAAIAFFFLPNKKEEDKINEELAAEAAAYAKSLEASNTKAKKSTKKLAKKTS